MNPQLLNNRYRILQTLGAGGFGNTFLAEDTYMPSGRRCVIKQLKPVTNNPQMYQEIQQRFGREAATLEQLGEGSDQIPKLYAYFSEGGQFYLVQEWIQGQTLTNKVQLQGPQPENTVKQILVSLLPVLDYVHSKRMIHRDVKPDNIIVRQHDGKPVLIDFGAVKESMGTVANYPGQMAPSIVVGTPGFMPPEQATGQPVYSSDLYGLGLTSVYMLTGKMPQELPTDPRTGEIQWQQYAPNTSRSLVTVLDRAIQPHPRDRYSTAKEMLDALQAVAPSSPNAATQATVAVAPGGHHQPGSSPQNIPPTISPAPVGSGGARIGQGNPQKVLLIGSAIAGSLVLALAAFGLLSKRSSQPSSPVASSSPPAAEAPVQEPATSPRSYSSPAKPSKVKAPPAIAESPASVPAESGEPETAQSKEPEPTRSVQPEPTSSSPSEPVRARQPLPRRPNSEPARSPDSQVERSPQPEIDNNKPQSAPASNSVPSFPVGTSRSTVEASLGKRTKDYKGTYGATRAVVYKLVPNQIDLGYLYDSSSGRVRQTEASFAESVDPQVMVTTLDGLLEGGANDYVKQGLRKVQQGRSNSYTFTQGALRGQIVKQDCGFIYISIWEANLHDFDVSTARRC